MNCPQCGAKVQADEQFCHACGVALAVTPPQPPRYAGFWLRLVACLIDSLLIGAVVWAITAPLGGFMKSPTGATSFFFLPFGAFYGIGSLTQLIATLGYWIYFAAFESSKWQATPGKRLLHLVVTDANGRPLNFGKATGRYFGKLLSVITIMIGYIIAGFTKRKQALHDIVMHTLVVRAESPVPEPAPAQA